MPLRLIALRCAPLFAAPAGAPAGAARRAPARRRAAPACSSGRADAETESLTELEARLALAVAAEDYALAAALRDAAAAARGADPIRALEARLAAAVAAEDFTAAAAARDELHALAPPPPPAATATAPPADLLPTTSSCTTDGIRVDVTSYYVPDQSRPQAGSFLFAYRVTIANESHDGPVKLVAREWRILDARGQERQVRGPGVVGETPVLKPGEEFSYQSACPLPTPHGSMRGEFEMLCDLRDAGWGKSFLAAIAPFGLSASGGATFP